MRSTIALVSAGLLGVIGTVAAIAVAAPPSTIPLVCTKGPSDQKHQVAVTAPASAAQGSTFHVRIDGMNSGKISHVGLNYIFDMGYEWVIPRGTQLVAQSARIVPGTGSENVRKGARVAHKGSVVSVILPARVENGSNYTPPSFEFDLKVTAPAGETIAQAFKGYRVTANAFLVGDVYTTCDPKPKPFPVATTKVEAAP
jgi:hypothetical protein